VDKRKAMRVETKKGKECSKEMKRGGKEEQNK
jgi:hypothetical protein